MVLLENNKLLLSVVVTVYNEKETILAAIKQVQTLDLNKEIIVIDNCSTDGTQDLLREYCDNSIRLVLQNKNMGYGQSVITGCDMAQGKYIYIHNSDLEYDPSYVTKMIAVAEEENLDAVFGSRLTDRKTSILKVIYQRHYFLAAILSTFMINIFYNKNLTDIIGSKFYKVSSLKSLYPFDDKTITFDFELVSKLCKRGYRIKEIPVSYAPRTAQQGKKIKWFHSITALLALLRVKLMN
jgi:glycosyltransferase involved in cell wall biosynthesis